MQMQVEENISIKKKPILNFERGTSSIRITGRFELFLDILIAENRRFNFGIFTLYWTGR